MAKGPQFDYEEETPAPGKLLKLDPGALDWSAHYHF
jgi:hypothetical protein